MFRKGSERMPDYKEMYAKLFRASEQAIDLLIAAQRECEELYIQAADTRLEFLLPPDDKPAE